MSSLWLVITALAAFGVAYRLYGAFLAAKVGVLNDARLTAAHRLKDGVDYHPTNKWVLFGHHFAAIAGPGPLIGPVLAAQWGFLPGFIWIVLGACLAGAVHDFVILLASVRQDGMSLAKLARTNIGPLSGITTSVATLFIVVATLASVALVVVNALAESAWGTFTIVVTIPAALLTGLWMYKIRPGKVAEASAIGVAIVLAGVFLGRPFADSSFGHTLLFAPQTLKLILPVYAAIAAILPVWVLMCPRDYLSSYMKIGVIVVLAVGILAVAPQIKMPATTPFISGGGPVIPGPVWPFVCIVIMCGAISGFHALIASGTTPKMINRESDIRPIGYGAMVLEGFVSVTALVAACSLEPGDYFKINVPPAKYDALVASAAAGQFGANGAAASGLGAHDQPVASGLRAHAWDLSPREFTTLESGTGEQPRPDGKGGTTGGLAGRTGGAVTLAVGMAKVFSAVPGLSSLMSYFYHFVIMFEALFILTLLETGTRVARFVFQETVAQFTPAAELGHKPHWGMNIAMSLLTCFCWGGLLWLGDLGTLWSMLGIANQLLAAIALAVSTTYLLNHATKRVYAFCTGIPFVFVLVTTFAAGITRVQEWLAKIPTAPSDQIFLLRLVVFLATALLALTVVIALDSGRRWAVVLKTRPAIAVPQRETVG